MGRTSLKGSYYIGLTSNLSSGKWRACDRFFSPQAAPKPLRLQTAERLPQAGITYSRCRSAWLSAMTFSSRAVQLLWNQSFLFQEETFLPRRPSHTRERGTACSYKTAASQISEMHWGSQLSQSTKWGLGVLHRIVSFMICHEHSFPAKMIFNEHTVSHHADIATLTKPNPFGLYPLLTILKL